MKTLILILFSVLLVFATDWSTFRGNSQRTGYTLEKAEIPKDKAVWEFKTGATIVSSPSIVNGILYIGARDSSLYAINISTGRLLWKAKIKGWADSSPLIYKEKVIIGGRDNKIHVFDKESGNAISAMNAGVQLSSPGITAEGNIFSGLGPPFNGFALYKKNMLEEKWKVPFNQMSYSSPALFGDLAVIGANDGNYYCLNIEKDSTIWKFKTGGSIYLSTPAIDDSVVYFASGNRDFAVYALGLKNGALKWKSSDITLNKIAKQAARISGQIHPRQFLELLRYSPADRKIIIERLKNRGINVPDLLLKTSTKMDTTYSVWDFYAYGGMKTSSVCVGVENVYIIQKELGYPLPRFSIIAINKKSGKEVWYFSEIRNSEAIGYCSSPIEANGKVFFGWGDGMFYALNSSTGEKLWSDTLDGHIISSPAIAAGKIFVATSTGNIYAYDSYKATSDSLLSFKEGTFCYPNPARLESNIQFTFQKDGELEVRIYDNGERLVKVFKGLNIKAHTKDKVVWQLSNVANGVYFATVKAKYKDGTEDWKILKIAVLK